MIIKIKRIERRTITEKPKGDFDAVRARVAELLLDPTVKKIEVINPLANKKALFIKLDVTGWFEEA